MVDTCAGGRWHASLHEVEAFQPEVTCLKFVTCRKAVAPPKGRNRASRLREIQQILGHRLLFRRLRALHDKLCFQDTDVTAALKIISEQKGCFYENLGHRDAWSTDMSAMVRSQTERGCASSGTHRKVLARASGRNDAGRRNAGPRRLANAGGRRATAEAGEHA